MSDKHLDVDAYIEAQSGVGRAMAEVIRTIIARAMPDRTETIKYNMPAFQIAGKSFLYLAVWKKHIGLYPVYRGDADFERTLAPFRAEKDTLQFQYDAPLLHEIVEVVAVAQALRLRP
jgi:uncharacterized protein YdhG (YjbR/CyaY superfamily)